MEKALIYEFIGTAIMILMGGGVVANSNLEQAKSKGAGWINIAFGWGFGVFLGVIVAGPHSGAHLNPAVTLAFATTGMFPWASVAGYVLAQISGAFLGAILVYFFFKNHFDATDDKELKLAIFSTMPAIKHRFHNMLAEVIGTFVLIFVILNIAGPTIETGLNTEAKIGLGSIGALPVAFLVVGIGMSLGGVTGYAINPARDLGPRIAHFLLPIKGKRDSGWSYAPIPVVGPVIGAVLASWAFLLLA
jgi:glycerol uptake facilitator protein